MNGGSLLLLASIILAFPYCTCQRPEASIHVDGSSTVYVLSEAVAEEYQKKHQGQVSVGVSGTGGGFKKLCSKRARLIGASRPISAEEAEECRKQGIELGEFAIAQDGIVIAVNPKNAWIKEIDIAMLKKLFEPEAEGKINKWSDLDPAWPEQKISIFAPGISSGTYDYFTKIVTGMPRKSRGDTTSSEDDNVLVHGVRSNVYGIGFFSFAHYIENRDDLKALAVISPEGHAVSPSKESIKNGQYKPFSRPIFLYAASNNLSEPERNFLHFFLQNAPVLADEVGFVELQRPGN